MADCSWASAPDQDPTISASARKRAAVLIFDGVQIIDYAGPWEILDAEFDVFSVAENASPITTSGGMSVNPTYTIDNAPRADILVVPGGGSSRFAGSGVGSQMANPGVIRWVRDEARDATFLMSVCNGAFWRKQAYWTGKRRLQ
jgi:putative intracellular protease/amidase